MRWDKETPEHVERVRTCKKCGRLFKLDYNPRTGEAQESWQTGCETMDECRKRILGALSDFEAKLERERPRCCRWQASGKV
jgi:hypothetical protein